MDIEERESDLEDLAAESGSTEELEAEKELQDEEIDEQ
jgi:hypothetical protein